MLFVPSLIHSLYVFNFTKKDTRPNAMWLTVKELKVLPMFVCLRSSWKRGSELCDSAYLPITTVSFIL